MLLYLSDLVTEFLLSDSDIFILYFVRVYCFACVHGDGLWSPHLLQAEARGDGDLDLGGEQPGLLHPRAEAGVEAKLHELHPHRDGGDGQWLTLSVNSGGLKSLLVYVC